ATPTAAATHARAATLAAAATPAAAATSAGQPVPADAGGGDVTAAPYGLAGAPLARWRVRLPRAFPTRDREHAAEVRREYEAALAGGVESFLEEPRTTCPWCGERQLRKAFVGADVNQAKPGRFRYDRCLACGHVFQNPRLTPAGLGFYYRDFYDGLGGPLIETIFSFSADVYYARARTLPPPAPRSWLDVGAGLGHFCLIARDVYPTASFDGLDIGDGIGDAARRGWVDHAWRGQFVELTGQLAGRYDVVSMFHYLEHTRDPLAELDAAAAVLPGGGYLLIEVPNPQSPAASVYRSLWPGWLVPQHQHLMPADNLVAALEQRGLRVQKLEFGETHQPGDAPFALWSLVQRIAPSPTLPWRAGEPYPALRRARRAAAGVVLGPLLPAAVLVDALSRGYLTAGRRANAYRVLARKE
ncbi:MAG: class I SAM-dependent methyltransferase, partial [Frankia sp.]|nr:class I SAM-dependent methyltransferase [Frankia sp.]